jgi:hypothetical protein
MPSNGFHSHNKSTKIASKEPPTPPRSSLNNYFGTLFFSAADPLPPIPSGVDTTPEERGEGVTLPESRKVAFAHERCLQRLAEQARAPGGCDDAYPMHAVADASKLLGHFDACIRFKENYQELFMDSHPQLALQPPEEAVRTGM